MTPTAASCWGRYFWAVVAGMILLGTGGGVSEGYAQSEEATAYVFREPVPEGEKRRVIRKAKQKSRWPSEEQFVGRTPLVASESSPFGSGALRTENRFPNKTEGVRQRYPLVIEAGGETYRSRTLIERGGNYPRYHMLNDPTAVRVGLAPATASADSASPADETLPTAASGGKLDIGLSWAERFGLLGEILLFGVITLGIACALFWGLGWYLDARRVEEVETTRRMDETDQGESEDNASDEREVETVDADHAQEPAPADNGEKRISEDEAKNETDNPMEAEDLEVMTSESEEQPDDTKDVSPSVSDLFGDEEDSESQGDQIGDADEAAPDTDDEDAPEAVISPRERRIQDRCGAAFADWCREEDALRSVGGRFEWFLDNELSPSASVSHWAVQSDGEYSRIAPSGATHWVVETKRAAVLFPRPRGEEFASAHGYDDMKPPDQITEATPAVVSVEGDALSLRETGRLR